MGEAELPAGQFEQLKIDIFQRLTALQDRIDTMQSDQLTAVENLVNSYSQKSGHLHSLKSQKSSHEVDKQQIKISPKPSQSKTEAEPETGAVVPVQEEEGKGEEEEEVYMTFETTMERLKSIESLTLEESVWDAALFIGIDVVGSAASVMCAIALLLNSTIQVFFCLMAQGPMIRDMKLDADEVKIWRETVGHSAASHDNVMKSSLVSRVCADDGSLNYAAMQTDAVHDILLYQDLYFGEGTPYVGIMLCLIVLFVWFLTMAQEVLSVYQHFVAYWKVPKHPLHTRFLQTEDGLAIKTVSYFRVQFVCFILLLRLAIALSLLFSGATWLCKTFSVPDLVLNGAALAFILDIDDIIFKTIVPRGAESLVTSLEPLSLGRPWIWKGLGGRWLFMVGGFAFVSFMAWYELLPFNQKLESTMRYMCAGDQDWYWERHDNGTFMFTLTEKFLSPEGEQIQDGDVLAREVIRARVGDWSE
eukprot:gnl/TRDRNA2_/TRDRNA2_177713_c0_seq1.p1 gnl/TRDRNA2_/TRDRNA2_177713_c0~~gnl/TRDRNA2_/TRDRNA2_177713_c0_seq1.p1  ORF type:complete len:544 (-),score=86.20 gnl/TRDRNA2_/TRDRNA2_177713_c0_seq1:74-1495(-)